jgi:hypothetical protein
MTLAEFFESLTPLRVILFWVVPVALTQIYMAQRDYPYWRRALWALALVFTALLGFAAFYLFEILPARRQQS